MRQGWSKLPKSNKSSAGLLALLGARTQVTCDLASAQVRRGMPATCRCSLATIFGGVAASCTTPAHDPRRLKCHSCSAYPSPASARPEPPRFHVSSMTLPRPLCCSGSSSATGKAGSNFLPTDKEISTHRRKLASSRCGRAASPLRARIRTRICE